MDGRQPPAPTTATSTPTPPTVNRQNKMGLTASVSYVIGNILGAGIFITPVVILQHTKSVGLSLCVWLVAGIISTLGAFCYVELGTSVRMSGCDFAYACHVKAYPIAFSYMLVGCLVNYPAVVAIQLQTLGEYLFIGLGIDEKCEANRISLFWARRLLEMALLWMLMFINMFSLKKCASRFNIIASASKVAATLTIILIGAYYFLFKEPQQEHHFIHPFANSTFTAKNVVFALFAALFTFDGYDILNFGTEEVAPSRRTLPLAIVIGLSAISLIFIAINISYFAVLDIPTFLSSNAVGSTFIHSTLGDSYSFLMPCLVCTLMIGSLNSSIFVASRYLHAASRAAFLPSFISCTSIKSDSPRAALILHTLLAFVMLFAGDLHILLNYVGFAQISQRAVTMCVLFWIRYKRLAPSDSDVIKQPLVVPIAFFLICVGLVGVTIYEDIAIASIVVVTLVMGLVFYMLFMREGPPQWLEAHWKRAREIDSLTTSVVQVSLRTMPQHLNVSDNKRAVPYEVSIEPILQKNEHEQAEKEILRQRASGHNKIAPADTHERVFY